MVLNAGILTNIKNEQLDVPSERLLSLPEKVLQFGTGVLLRGLPDYFIHEANSKNIFNGRIVVVKSTETGGSNLFEDQDGLFTVFVRGFEEGKEVDTKFINASISRVISAKQNWEDILLCAENPEMQIIISNTTEIGISLVRESIFSNPPASFPAKLLSFMWNRYQHFHGAPGSGLVIIPTELISENGAVLKKIVLELAAFNQLDQIFINWLNDENDFCNSLVDRIVPGKLSEPEKSNEEAILGYTDSLMIMCEPYCLWAIETNSNKTKDILSFANVNQGVKIESDINQFKELKLRLLNATHSFSCALALYCGFETVREAMKETYFRNYVASVMMLEIKPLILSSSISEDSAQQFAEQVIDRFRNNSIEHKWISISMQYSSKMEMRTVPLIIKHLVKYHESPKLMVLGFAAYLLFMQTIRHDDGIYYSKLGNANYPVTDEKAALLHQYWESGDLDIAIPLILKDISLWGVDLNAIDGFSNDMISAIKNLRTQGAKHILHNLLSQNLMHA